MTVFEFIRQKYQKYNAYAEEYNGKIVELQKRTASIFILLNLVYIVLLYIEKPVVREELMGVLFVIAVSTVHYLLFRHIVWKHHRLIRPLSLLYSIIILLTVINVNAFFGLGLSVVAIDVAMVLIAATIVVPMHYWIILLLSVAGSVAVHGIYLSSTGSMETLDMESLRHYVIVYVFLCMFTIIINLSFSALKYKEIEAEQQLLHKSRTDVLTGLYNREYLEDCVGRAKTGVMICIDVDYFKQVNDSLGHKAGDRLLTDISTILKKHFRKTDCIARIGGDEFLIFLEDMTERESVLERVERLLSEFPLTAAEADGEVSVTLSVGVAFADAENMSYKKLYEKSDEAMYKAKKGGRGRAVVLAAHRMPEQVIISNTKQK